MYCSYCGKEIKNYWGFCMHCGTKVQQEETVEVDFQIPESLGNPFDVLTVAELVRNEEPVAEAPLAEETTDAEAAAEFPFVEVPLGRKVTIDPEKFEFYPEQRDVPLSRSVSSWELVPADTVAPKIQLPAKRGLGKMIFLGLITLGIYPTVIYSRIITELNIAASRHDGKRTMPYFGMLMLAPLTLGIFTYVWFHKLCARIGEELQRRGIDYKFGPSQFWLWGVLGAFILVGPFIFTHKLMKSMNLLNKNYNEKG